MFSPITPYSEYIARPPKVEQKPTSWEYQELVRLEIEHMNNLLAKLGEKSIVDANSRMSLEYTNLLAMKSQYDREEIFYSGFMERAEEFLIIPYREKLYTVEGELITTSPLDFNKGAILVMTQQGTLFLSHKDRNVVHHSTFLAGAPVAYACILEARDGVIIKEQTWSGHYEPSLSQQRQFHDRLKRDYLVDYDSKLRPVFLPVGPLESFDKGFLFCAMTGDPLFDPIELPCGHIFNQRSLLAYSKKNGKCPLDNKDFKIQQVVQRSDAVAKNKLLYQQIVESRISINAGLDQKIASLGLDDRDEKLKNIPTTVSRRGVLLFLNENSEICRVAQIAKELGKLLAEHCYVFSGVFKFYRIDNTLPLSAFAPGILSMHF